MKRLLLVISCCFLSLAHADINEVKYKEKEVDVVGLFVGDHKSIQTKMYYIVDKTNKLCFARFTNKSTSSGGATVVSCESLKNTPSLKQHITW